MADVEPLKAALIDACLTLTAAGKGAAQSAMATAGIARAEDLPAGMEMPHKNLNEAGTLASQAAQTMAAVYSCADALAKLEDAFPTIPVPPPTEPTP